MLFLLPSIHVWNLVTISEPLGVILLFPNPCFTAHFPLPLHYVGSGHIASAQFPMHQSFSPPGSAYGIPWLHMLFPLLSLLSLPCSIAHISRLDSSLFLFQCHLKCFSSPRSFVSSSPRIDFCSFVRVLVSVWVHWADDWMNGSLKAIIVWLLL
jgi:hypothetical protein